MNYKRIYAQLCLSRMLMKRKKGGDEYYENHHYLPESLGGPNIPSNMVLLTAKEQYIAHFLLYKIYKQNGITQNTHKMALALMFMKTRDVFNSHTYHIARKAVSEAKKGKSSWNKGKKGVYSEETLKKMSTSSKGRQTRLGAKLSDETKKKIGKKSKNRGKKVYQYDLQGNFVCSFVTAKQAADKTGKNSTSIIKCCNGQIPHYSGYIWRYTYRQKIKSTFKPINKPVLQFDLQGNFIQEWSGQREVLNTLGIHDVGRVCKGINKTAGGFLWRYKEDMNLPYKIGV